MKRFAKPQAVLLSVSMVTLALAGVLYGHWTDTLEAHAVVDTGEIKAGWITVRCVESTFPGVQVTPGPGGGDITATEPGFVAPPEWSGPTPDESTAGTPFWVWETNKNVAHRAVPAFLDDNRTVELMWFNTYPSFTGDCEMEFRNTGTLPIAVPYLVIMPGEETTLASDIFADDGEIWIDWSSGTPPNLQIDPGERETASLKLHVEQSAEQDRTGDGAYTFLVQVCYHNWNEPTDVEDDVCDLYEEGDGKIVIPDPFS